MRTNALIRTTTAMLLVGMCAAALAQSDAKRTKYWTGGSGAWDDTDRWSLAPGGPGGAGVPRVNEDVVIATNTATEIVLPSTAWCRDLQVSASGGSLAMAGTDGSELNIAGAWRMMGPVQWSHSGEVRLVQRKGGVELDLRGIPIAARVVMDGGGSWSLASDLVLAPGRPLVLRQGTLITNGNLVKAGALVTEGRGAKRIVAGNAVFLLEQDPDLQALRSVVEPGNSTLQVSGRATRWGEPVVAEGSGQRDINICGTGPGQTPFTVDAQVITNYNGFGVSCRGACDATVTVTVSGGIGPFTYQWLNGGPTTATWTTACGGPQIVIVTDVGQGISCPVSVNVSEPAPLGVIFFGAGTPPTCPDVCDGSRQALAVGGVDPISYSWNNGAGTAPAFFELCAGLNTLLIVDANGCQFDTTFFFNLQPLQPNLTFTPTSCFGECDGTAQIAPEGGTVPYTITWSPPPPIGQGTTSVEGLCAGPWSVTLLDANGCDTTVNFLIEEPLPILPGLLSTDATCFGTCDGTASVSPTGPLGPFGFIWNPAPGDGQGTANVTGLCEGTYTVLITDLNTGCDTLVTVTIDAPGAIDMDGTVGDATCADECDGTITVITSGGTAPYNYVWTPEPSVGQGTPSVSQLCPGTWILTVSDAAGCDTTVTFQVNSPPPIDPQLTFTPVTCAGECDGTATVVVSGGVPAYTYLWSPAPPVGQGTATVSGLCAGPYSLLITDDNGCDTTLAFVIDEPPVLEAISEQTDVTCGGLCDGTASVAVGGGTPPYTYTWSPEPINGQGTPAVTDLCAGDYSVLITDAVGCELVVDFTIDDPGDIQISLQVLPASCPNVCDGETGVIATGGTPPFDYVWSPEPGGGQGTPNVTGLCPQAYLLTVTDAAGCDTTIAFTVDAPDAIDANATVTNATCAGECNGSIALAPTGGNGTYTYVWSPQTGGGQGTATATGLCAGPWEVTISSGGCDSTFAFVIEEPLPLDVDLLITDPTCGGVCDGTASVTASGGTAPYDFNWVPTPGGGQGGPDATGLCPGNYSVTITDALGCDTTLAFVVLEPVPIEFELLLTEAGCDSICAGTATVTMTGGNGPFTFFWEPGIIQGQGTNAVTGLCTGFYNLTITDAFGCDTITQLFIVSPSDIEVVPTVTDVSCSGACDGAIDVVTSAGAPPYTFQWTPEPPVGQGTPNISGLCAGIWQLRIVDSVACDTIIQVVVNEPTPIEPNGTSVNESCNGPCDGTAAVAPTGGVPPYSYFWAPVPPNGQGTPDATDLCPGEWSVTITDATGCDTTVTFLIEPQQPIDAGLVVQDPPCANACEGTASVSPSGGVEPYTFVWSPVPPNGQGTASVSGLCAGAWEVLITDDLGCDTAITFLINAPPVFDLELILEPEDCTAPCTGSATINASGGTGTLIILWQPEPGGGQGTNVATGLCAGTPYSVTITDDNGCDSTLTYTVDPFEDILPNSSSTPVTCAGSCDGTATVGPTGGDAPYTYQWTPEPGGGQGTPQATGLCAGVVEVTITDADGCQMVASILILGPDPLVVGATQTDVSCNGACDGSVVLAPQGGTAPYLYTWSPVPPNGQGSNAAVDLCPGNWSVTLFDANGCDTTFTFTITEPPVFTLALTATPSECVDCVGTVTATVNGGVPFYDIQWTDALGNVVGTGEVVTGLCANVFTATVTDANGCVAQAAVPVSDANGEVIDTVDGSTSCPNTCDGTVSVNFTCADPPCSIAWSDANGNPLGQTGTTLENLCAGTYLVTVTNASGCVTIESAEVISPTSISTNISSSPVTCAGACNGTATVGIAGGVPPFIFTWDPAPGGGQGTPFATGLCAGVYTIAIADGQGCDTTVSVLILEPLPVLLDAVVEDISCQGSCDGSIVLVAQGGTAPYTYLWDPVPPNGQGSNGAFGLCAGDWSVVVTDANGCSINDLYSIQEPDELQLSLTATPSTCTVCDGTATATVSGGTVPYTYAWTLNGIPVPADEAPTDLCSGLYVLVVTDANGCSVQAAIPIPDSDAEVLTTIDGQASCANDCDGTVGVDVVCSAPPCVANWTDALGNVIAMDQTVVPDLCPGTYTVEVINANGCISFATAEVLPTQVITPNLSSTPASCAGVCDGTATVGPTGGVAPYDYLWSPEPDGGQGTPQATGLCAGVYSVLIADASGCDTTITVLILEPQPLVLNATVQNGNCTDACDGFIVATVQGGAAPYTYAWDPEPPNGQGSNGAFDLCAGAYTLTVTDASGCTTAGTWNIAEPDPITLVGTTTPSECGSCVGTVSVTANGGTPGYNYFWTLDGAIVGTGPALTDLCAGLYIVQVIDANACEALLLVPVTDSDGEETTTTDGVTTCPGDCDGEVSVDFTCSDPPCTIAWSDAAGNDLGVNGNTVTGLCEGAYFVLVTNATGCITVDTAFVLEPDPIVANLSTTPESCFGACDGTATVGPTGGAGGFQYFWDPEPPIGQGTPQAEGLCAGPLTVTITDLDGCSIQQGVLILGPDPLTAEVLVEEPTCASVCDGTIVISPLGGTAPYSYSWTPEPPNGQGSNAAFDLCAGVWSVTITDDNGCTLNLDFDLQEPLPLVADITTTDNLCFGDCQGAAQVVTLGGTGAYANLWTNAAGDVLAQDVDAIADLCAGGYVLTVTDANGCSLEVPFNIGEESAIEAGLLVTGETCFGPCDGNAAVSPAGGIGPYDILWQPEPDQGQGTEQASGLCASLWSVTITDLAGCDTTLVFVVLPFEEITDNATVQEILCQGDCSGSVVTAATGGVGALNWNWVPEPPNGQGTPDATGLCPGGYELTITDAVGCDSTFFYNITEPDALVLSVDEVLAASCANAADGAISTSIAGGVPPYDAQWTGPDGFTAGQEDISSLAPGTYQITVTDDNGCTIATTVEVDALVTVVADAGGDLELCAGVTVVLDGGNSIGAVTYTWTNDQGEVVGTDDVVTITGLGSGTYTFTLAVSDGPCTSTDQVVVIVLALPIADAGPDQTIFLSETATLGGNPTAPLGSVITWSPDSLLNDGSASNPIADPAQTTWFFVSVTSPDGCTSTDSVLVTVVPDIIIPSGFTPNGDGRNDTWIIDFIELFPNSEVEVYNRWGELLFQSVGYRQPWDGRYSGGFVPVGTYYYVVKLNDPEFPEPFIGPLTVIR